MKDFLNQKVQKTYKKGHKHDKNNFKKETDSNG